MRTLEKSEAYEEALKTVRELVNPLLKIRVGNGAGPIEKVTIGIEFDCRSPRVASNIAQEIAKELERTSPSLVARALVAMHQAAIDEANGAAVEANRALDRLSKNAPDHPAPAHEQG